MRGGKSAKNGNGMNGDDGTMLTKPYQCDEPIKGPMPGCTYKDKTGDSTKVSEEKTQIKAYRD